MRPQPLEDGSETMRRHRLGTWVEPERLSSSARTCVKIHLARQKAKMTAEPKGGVVDVELADTTHRPYSIGHSRNQVGERARLPEGRPA